MSKALTIQNKIIGGSLFWQSLNRLMEVKELTGKTKLGLAQLKSALVAQFECIQSSVKSCGEDKEKIDEILDQNYDIILPFDVDLEEFADHVSAGDLFQLNYIVPKE